MAYDNMGVLLSQFPAEIYYNNEKCRHNKVQEAIEAADVFRQHCPASRDSHWSLLCLQTLYLCLHFLGDIFSCLFCLNSFSHRHFLLCLNSSSQMLYQVYQFPFS